MKRNIKQNSTLDLSSARLLAELAARETEGNKSQFLRMMIREAADARGIRADQLRPAEVNLTEGNHA